MKRTLNITGMDLENLTYNEAAGLLERYPGFTYAAVIALRQAPDAESRRRLRSIICAQISDESALHEALELDSESMADFYPDNKLPQLDTIDTIDTFLEHFGGDFTRPEALPPAVAAVAMQPEAEKLTVDDKPSQIHNTEKQKDDTLPDAKSKQLEPHPVSKADKPTSSALTESFARILIKNGNYSKALEIITELNLKNSEKNIYFADQIRFLKKLIINENKKNGKF